MATKMTLTSNDAQISLSLRQRLARIEQGTLVLFVTVATVVIGAVSTPGFLTAGNFSVILQLSAAFGIVAAGEALVVLSKGVDLSVGAIALVTAQATLELTNRGLPETQ